MPLCNVGRCSREGKTSTSFGSKFFLMKGEAPTKKVG